MRKLSLFIGNFRLYCVNQEALLLYLPLLVITLSELGLFCTLWFQGLQPRVNLDSEQVVAAPACRLLRSHRCFSAARGHVVPHLVLGVKTRAAFEQDVDLEHCSGACLCC